MHRIYQMFCKTRFRVWLVVPSLIWSYSTKEGNLIVVLMSYLFSYHRKLYEVLLEIEPNFRCIILTIANKSFLGVRNYVNT